MSSGRATTLIRAADEIVAEQRASGGGLSHFRAADLERTFRELERLTEADVSLGDYTALLVRAQATGDSYMRDVVTTALTRAGTLQHLSTADTPGLLVEKLSAPLVTFVDAERRAISASTRLTPPVKGKTFTRPIVTNEAAVDEQVAEGDVLESHTLDVDTSDPLTKRTFGGTLAISEQDVDDSDPAIIDEAWKSLARSYAVKTSVAHCVAISAAVTATADFTIGGAPDAFVAALASATTTVHAAFGDYGDVLFLGSTAFEYLLALTDSDGRPIFTDLDNVVGLKAVPDRFADPNAAIVAAARGVEAWESEPGGAPIVFNPDQLSTTIAWRGRFTSFVAPEAIVSLQPAA